MAISAVLLLVAAPVLAGLPASGSALQARTATADPTVGPLFPAGTGSDHTCTASVLAVGADLLLTAAHCIAGTGAGMVFVPGYDGTAADPQPYGVWQVSKAWVDPAWSATGSASADFAILQVAPHGTADHPVELRTVTGGNTIGGPAQPGMAVTVPAYAIGNDDAPFACTVDVYEDEGSPAFDCEGYPGGTSGSPWLTGAGTADGERTVVGVIGGLRQGGCRTDTSYSPTWGPVLIVLLLRGLFDLPGDTVTQAPDSGC